MGLRKRAITSTVVLGVAGALMSPAAPAGAAGDETASLHVESGLGLHGRKARVMSVVYDYFEARDKGWLDPAESSTALSVLRANGGALAAQPAKFAAVPATVANEAEDENGLRATKVLTGFGQDSRVRFRGRTATVTLTAGTVLNWNNDEIGESSLHDTYTVTLEREKKTWRITDVSYAPVPSTESEESGPPIDLGDLPLPSDANKAQATDAGEGEGEGEGDVSVLDTGTYDRDAAAAYAQKWSKQTPYTFTDATGRERTAWEENHNPDYETFDNNCANFVSQSLHAGGWEKAGGWNKDDDDTWTNDLFGPRGPSTTWSVAYRLWTYAINDKRGERLRTWPPDDPTGDNQDVWSLEKGDLLFADWDPYGAADGKIDHAMIITRVLAIKNNGHTFYEPAYSQNSGSRTNLPLSIGMKIATGDKPDVDPVGGIGGQGRAPIYYPVHLKDTFEK
ncbi:amidase domain-containing protein [Streptomyces pristinaespiralis]|uniref:amidase domain-containing protein n=1 Tax=Streptomyces pristinaespiralis TaxID=38300 RepID=UPI003839997F